MSITEIASDLYRLTTYVPEINLQFTQFLVHDEEPLTHSDVVDRARQSLIDYQASLFANYIPYTPQTDPILQKLAELQPKTIATMHGSVFAGDGKRAIQDFAIVLREVFGKAE